MDTAIIVLIIGGIPVLAAAIVSIIVALRTGKAAEVAAKDTKSAVMTIAEEARTTAAVQAGKMDDALHLIDGRTLAWMRANVATLKVIADRTNDTSAVAAYRVGADELERLEASAVWVQGAKADAGARAAGKAEDAAAAARAIETEKA